MNHLYVYVSGNPIRRTDPLGLAPKFTDLNQAAISAMRHISKMTDDNTREYGGWIRRVGSQECGVGGNQLLYTYDEGAIREGIGDEVDLGPDGPDDIAFFHSHCRAGSPKYYETFSPGDKFNAKHDGNKLITGFLLTLSKRFLRFDPLDFEPEHGSIYEIH